jgi:hypothetical protein
MLQPGRVLTVRGHRNFTPRGYMDRPPVSRAPRHGPKICSLKFLERLRLSKRVLPRSAERLPASQLLTVNRMWGSAAKSALSFADITPPAPRRAACPYRRAPAQQGKSDCRFVRRRGSGGW